MHAPAFAQTPVVAARDADPRDFAEAEVAEIGGRDPVEFRDFADDHHPAARDGARTHARGHEPREREAFADHEEEGENAEGYHRTARILGPHFQKEHAGNQREQRERDDQGEVAKAPGGKQERLRAVEPARLRQREEKDAGDEADAETVVPDDEFAGQMMLVGGEAENARQDEGGCVHAAAIAWIA